MAINSDIKSIKKEKKNIQWKLVMILKILIVQKII
jgi:hypothetical protein